MADANDPKAQVPGQMPMMGMPMGMPMQGMPMGMGQNPMMAFMQMMQMMSGGMAMPQIDPAAIPFATPDVARDDDPGLDGDIIRPATFEELVRTQQAIPTNTVLDYMCLSEDKKHALGGVPKGCTMALVGPPGSGKTRSMLATLCRVAASGTRVAFVVAEEGFHDTAGSGRDDLCSRMTKIGMLATEMKDQKKFREKVLENVYVMESQYHKGQSWDDFVARYRYLVEKAEIQFVVIDSLNMLDPGRHHTADNLSALKTYNHEKGVTCICIGQIKDAGTPVGGEAMVHTADAVFLIEEMGLGSKEIAEMWGGKYRDKIKVIRAVKCVSAPTFEHPVRIDQRDGTGEMIVHELHPEDFALPELGG